MSEGEMETLQDLLGRETIYRTLEAKKLEIENLIREIKLTGYDINELENKYHNVNDSLSMNVILEKFSNILNSLKTIRVYSYQKVVLEYISNSISSGNFDINDLKHRYFETLSYMRTSEMFTNKKEENMRVLLYEVGYKLIEKEILLNFKSDILDEILTNEYDTMNMNLIINKKIEEIKGSTYINPNSLEMFNDLIRRKKANKDFKSYVDLEIIIGITLLTSPSELSNNIETKVDESLENLNTSIKGIEKSQRFYGKSSDLRSQNDITKNCIKEIQKRTINTLILISMVFSIYHFISSKRIEKDSTLYNVETAIYSTIDEDNISYEVSRHDKDTATLEVYKNELDKVGTTVRYKYTYNERKLKKLLDENFDYQTASLTDEKEKKKEIIEENPTETKEVRVLTTVKADKDKPLGIDEEYRRESIICWFIGWQLASFLPYGYSNNIIHAIANLIKYLKSNKKYKEIKESVDESLLELTSKIDKSANALETYEKMIDLFCLISKLEGIENQDLLNHYKEKLESHKKYINDEISSVESRKKELKLGGN